VTGEKLAVPGTGRFVAGSKVAIAAGLAPYPVKEWRSSGKVLA